MGSRTWSDSKTTAKRRLGSDTRVCPIDRNGRRSARWTNKAAARGARRSRIRADRANGSSDKRVMAVDGVGRSRTTWRAPPGPNRNHPSGWTKSWRQVAKGNARRGRCTRRHTRYRPLPLTSPCPSAPVPAVGFVYVWFDWRWRRPARKFCSCVFVFSVRVCVCKSIGRARARLTDITSKFHLLRSVLPPTDFSLPRRPGGWKGRGLM